MKILIANKFFFVNGGTDRYFFEIMSELQSKGHHAIPFSVRHHISKPSPYLSYFLPPPGPPHQTHYASIKLKEANWLRLLDRSIYSVEARVRLGRLLKTFGPVDVAYLLNIYNYMSPSIIHTLRRHRIPIVMRVGDYNLQCANYLFLRNGEPCVLCAGGAYYHAMKFRCVKKSGWLTALRVFSMYVHKILKLYDHVKAFIVPCHFMKSMLLQGCIPQQKIHILKWPVKIDKEDNVEPLKWRRPYILYFGRISYEKGLNTLLKAYQNGASVMAADLVFVGRDYDGELARLKSMVQSPFKENVHFIGFVEQEELRRWIRGSLFTVVPSRWYDNAPLSVYESYALKRPVVAARLGGLAEQVEDKVTGKLYSPESVSELSAALEWMLKDSARREALGKNGFDKVQRENNLKDYVQKLIDVFQSVL